MVSAALSPPPAKICWVSTARKTTRFPSRLLDLSTGVETRPKTDPFRRCCNKKSNADHPFEDFSILSQKIPWEDKSIWSIYAGYFLSLHIPLSFGGLSIVAQILKQPVLDPSIIAISALLLQTAETIGFLALLNYAAKPEGNLSSFFVQRMLSEQRSWIKASAFSTVVLIGLVLFTSILADRLIGTKLSKMQRLGNFKLPQFFNYPPYFTLQPVKETREKQVQLWKELILDYCKDQKIFVINLEVEFPLFTNTVIERSLSHEAREVFLSALVAEGRAEWLDKSHKKCLLLWLRIQDWADCILNFVKENGLEDSVMTVEDIRTGIESRGTELEGIDRGVLMRALRILEQKGKAAVFKGTSTDDEGVKFSA